MNYSLLIARRLLAQRGDHKRLSGPVVSVATAAVALGVAVMIVSVAVGMGFKQQIRDKLVGFGTHVQIMSMDFNQSYETSPIDSDTILFQQIRRLGGVKNVQPFIVKPGIIKTDEAFQGLALKGVDHHFDWTFLQSCLVEGETLAFADTVKTSGIVLSQALAEMLKLKIGDPVRMYFIQNGVRARRFTLQGIFNSHFAEFDQKMAFVDMRHLAALNGWDDQKVSGYEVQLTDFDSIADVASQISFLTSAYVGPEDTFLRTQSIYDLQPQMFGWLNLLDTNIIVILALIIAVASLNMISGLLILILENTNTIGLLKAMGATGRRIRMVFIYMAMKIIGRGLLIGNAVGIALCVAQRQWRFATLDPESYYLDTVPILLSGSSLLMLNLLTVVVTTLMLVGPSYIVARIRPAKAIRFN